MKRWLSRWERIDDSFLIVTQIVTLMTLRNNPLIKTNVAEDALSATFSAHALHFYLIACGIDGLQHRAGGVVRRWKASFRLV